MKHILFLMSDTGGGHRAACRAMEEALEIRYPGRFSFEMVDLWKDYTPFPFSTAPYTYTHWINTSPATYAAQFWINDRLFRLPFVSELYCRSMFTRMERMYREHPADIIVCAHSVFARPAVAALRRLRLGMPYITVITDWALPTVLWYDPRVDRLCVPTELARWRGRELRIPSHIMRLTGAPVHPKFMNVTLSKAEARAQLGWTQDAQVALLVGGGEGMGPLVATAEAIDDQDLTSELVVIAGRNEAMKAALEKHVWKRPTRVYGFVDNMQILLRAADVLITKAGPATITEAATLGTPLILSGAIAFQETPNAEYVVRKRAGLWAPGPAQVAEALARVFRNPAKLAVLVEGVKKLAQPDAIWNIADEIASFG
ncbi:MAG: glycosyltransferase [Anaerolineae bacterium]|nr:glycosyltransferase [Anaerolineae bacterium]